MRFLPFFLFLVVICFFSTRSVVSSSHISVSVDIEGDSDSHRNIHSSPSPHSLVDSQGRPLSWSDIENNILHHHHTHKYNGQWGNINRNTDDPKWTIGREEQQNIISHSFSGSNGDSHYSLPLTHMYSAYLSHYNISFPATHSEYHRRLINFSQNLQNVMEFNNKMGQKHQQKMAIANEAVSASPSSSSHRRSSSHPTTSTSTHSPTPKRNDASLQFDSPDDSPSHYTSDPYTHHTDPRLITPLDTDGLTKLSPNGPQFDMSLKEFQKTHGGLIVPKGKGGHGDGDGKRENSIPLGGFVDNEMECRAAFGRCMDASQCGNGGNNNDGSDDTANHLQPLYGKCGRGDPVLSARVCCVVVVDESAPNQYIGYHTGQSTNWLTSPRTNTPVLTPIRTQMPCNGCYAFAAIAVLESHIAIKTGRLYSFSERQIVDCTTPFDNHQCKGGWYGNVFRYFIQNENHQQHDSAVSLRSTYPYDGKVMEQSCNTQLSRGYQSPSFISSYYNIPKFDIPTMISFIDKGPIAAAIYISCDEVRHYKTGVIRDENGDCDGEAEHAVSIVGYGTVEDSGVDYWVIRNSWGDTWGEKGYGRVERGKNVMQIEQWVMAISIDVKGEQIPSYPVQ